MPFNYKGKYDPSTNTPFLQDGVGTLNDAYLILFNPSSSFIVTRDFGSGPISCLESYFLAYDGAKWYCVGNTSGLGTGSVTSVDITPGTGISATGGPITTAGSITVTNTLPDQIVSLIPSGTTQISGVYPNFNIYTPAGSSGSGTVTSIALSGGTGITIIGGPVTNAGVIDVINSLPDQTVVLTQSGTTKITGTYPNFNIYSSDASSGSVTSVDGIGSTGITVSGGPITNSGSLTITNTLPDRLVTVSGNTGISITGSYPSFGITNTNPGFSSGTVTQVSATPSTGISITGSPITTSGNLVITNTLPDRTVTISGNTGITVVGSYPDFSITNTNPSTGGTVTSIGLSGSTGISIIGGPVTNSGTIVVTNSAPDQTVILTGSGSTQVTGVYPSFKIFSASGNSGTVTSIATTAPLTGGPITSSGTIAIPNSTSLVDGYLSATNFSIFNLKQAALNGSGLVKSNAGSITYVSGASTQFVKADGSLDSTSYGFGTVTSITLSGSTGISISGGPITNSGTIVITNTSPNQTTVLTASGGTQIIGTYPNFNIYTGNVDQIDINDVGSSIPATVYTLRPSAKYPFTINDVTIYSTSGTCTVAIQINGVNVTSLSTVSVTSSPTTTNATGANTVVAGNKVTLTTSSNSSLINLQASLKITKT